MPDGLPQLMVLIGSTRPGRVGRAVADWFIEHAEQHGAFRVSVVDLAELDLPFLDEPNHPRLGRYINQHTRAWSEQVTAADAFVIVTPEYNHGYPAPLKNAIDFLHQEWQDKPVGFVSYGGISAGTRAVQQLKQVVATLKLHAVADAVHIPFVATLMGEDGHLLANEIMDTSAGQLLDEVARMSAALAPLRGHLAGAGY